MDLGRSVLRAILLDAGGTNIPPETFNRVATPLAGVSDVLDRMIYRLASALDMPASMLLGMPLTGLNPSGQGEIRMFYDKVSQKQDRHLRPRLEHLVKLVMLSKSGPTSGTVPPKWCVEFCPLWQPSQKEIVDSRLVQAQTDKAYFDMGAPFEDILRSRFSGDGYSFDTKFDFDTLDRVMEQEAAAKEAADAALAAKRAQAPVMVPGVTPPVGE
jgi:phage-related protein (TIGR01555 family)